MTDGLHDLARVIEIYSDDPLDNGDILLITDRRLIQECEAAADLWDPRVRAFVGELLASVDATEVALAVARPSGTLLPQDHAMWADLREDCAAAGIRLRDPIGLPAAA